MNNNNVLFFGMLNCIKLVERILKMINILFLILILIKFVDGEIMLVSDEVVRGKDVYIIVSILRLVNDNLMILYLFIDLLKRVSVKFINIVLVYYGYVC